jgi:putative lipoic acid-binding regulatory protein
MDTKGQDEFYARLKDELANSTMWPSDYLYKFIVTSDPKKIKQIQDIFNNMGAVIQTKKSSNGKYTSVSITVNLKNPDEVITKYKEVSVVEGVISL